MIFYLMIILFLDGNFLGHHQHGHGTVLLLPLIKNYRIQDTTYSEADNKCEIDSFFKLQMGRGAPKWKFDKWRGHVSGWQNRSWCTVP